MVYKCKICGGSVTVTPRSRIAVCDYCGTKQVLPLFSDESAQLLYDRGNSYLRQNEYDKAEIIFNQLLSLCPDDPEIYWDLVLCKYGVTFVNDSKSGKFIPTCNRTHYCSVFQDENYLNAIKYSDDETATYYKENAQTIENIQKGILVISKKEKPFDIFISFKDTDSNGARTKDSVKAQELYEKLTQAGYKVFFSRITLEDKIGTQYEPYIYAALSSSKVMLTVSSSKENIESAWIKNEWSRFLTLRQGDAGKTLIPLYFDMPKSDLPDEFAIFAAQDMTKEDFEQELLRGIKKMIPLPIMAAERHKKLRKIFGISAAVFAGVFLITGAISFPYIKNYLARNDDYKAAMQFYNEEKYAEAATAFGKLADFKNSSDMHQEALKAEKYSVAMQFYYDGNYPESAWAFRDMNGYKDSTEMQKKSELKWRESLATIATANIVDTTFDGGYYISENGSVDTFEYDTGAAHKNININEHGKVVSLGDNYCLYALHEDGYVTNSKNNNGLDADWDNIIQITPVFNVTNVALTNEGTVVYGQTENPESPDLTDYWLEEVSEWTDIVALYYGLDRMTNLAVIIGQKVDGSFVSVSNGIGKNIEPFLSTLKNIEDLSVDVLWDFNDSSGGIKIAAIDANSNLYTFNNGTIKSYKNQRIINIEVTVYFPDYYLEYFVIDNNLAFSRLGSDDMIMEDIVYVNKNFIVTRSGSIYFNYNQYDGMGLVDTGCKTALKDVWIERK